MVNEASDSATYDKGLIEQAIGKNSEIHVVKPVKFVLKGGEKIESRALVITSFRVFILTPNSKGPYKVDHNVHILDVHTIESKKPEEISVHYGEKNVIKFWLAKPDHANNVIAEIIANLKINFPGGNLHETLKKEFEPGEKLDEVNVIVKKLISSDALAEAGPCGGFSRSYACICDHLAMPFLEEVAWDIDTIYLSHDTKELNIQDFDHLENRELLPIIATLEYNTWFTKLFCSSYKLSTEILDVIAKVIKRSTTIEELVLDGVSLGREFCQKLATSLASNPSSALERIDLSNNPSADNTGIAPLSTALLKLSHGLSSLNLHDTNITNKGASTIGQMLKNSKYMSTSLTRLDLSHNPLKIEGVTAICDFLAQANSLTDLNLSYTECSVEQIFGALIRGCCQNLSVLNLSGNPFSQRKNKENNLPPSFQQFFNSTAALHEMVMSDCRVPPDAARALFLGLIENILVKEVDVDLSKNEFKTAGLRAITGPLSQISNLRCLNLSDNGFESDLVALFESLCTNKAVKKLHIGQNFNKIRNINNVMESLIKLISTENSPIEFLSLADSRLKQSITLLFDSLGTNESLIELDISGNMMGDEGARVLAKALQINNKLRTIHWDRNNVTQSGLRDIALALENNQTLQSMPTPITDVSMCLKPATEKALKQIEKCLSRNHSPSQAVTEQAIRLQQGLMMSSTQQQMVDRLIVQLQDTARPLGNSSDETVKRELQDARRCISDADKLKQLFLKFHMSTSLKSLQDRISSFSNDLYSSVQKQMKKNLENILNCAEDKCPFVTGKEGVKESLKTSCEGKGNISKAFIDTVILQQLAPVILNEVSEKNLSLSTTVADTMMDKVIQQLEQQQTRLELLAKEHKSSAELKPPETEETSDIIVDAAQKAKNRLSVAMNRHSRRSEDDDSEVFPSSYARRRPTINRKRKPSDVEDKADAPEHPKEVKKPALTKGLDLDIPVSETSELVHHTKNRARPVRGRRPPTKPSAQSATTGPDIKTDNVAEGLDNFFTKSSPARPRSAVLSSNVHHEADIHKSATISSQRSKKKNDKDKEGGEETRKETHEKSKKHGLLGGLGIFKKKSDKEKKSPVIPRKHDKKDHKKSSEDLADGVPSVDGSGQRHPSASKADKKSDKSHKEKPEKTDSAVADKEKESKKEQKHIPDIIEPVSKNAKANGSVIDEKEEKDEPKKENIQHVEPKKEDVKHVEKPKEADIENEGGKHAENETKKETEDSHSQDVEEAVKRPVKPKFGVGLPMGAMGGDLLAEMKKRKEKKNAPPPPEPKPRARLGTSPDAPKPAVATRPSSVKRPAKSKSAVDILLPVAPEPKPEAKRRSTEVKQGEVTTDENKPKVGATPPTSTPPKPTTPAKPTPPKEKPTIASRPTVPKRPPSIVRNRRSLEVKPPAVDENQEKKEKREPKQEDKEAGKGGDNSKEPATEKTAPAEELPKEKDKTEEEKGPVTKQEEEVEGNVKEGGEEAAKAEEKKDEKEGGTEPQEGKEVEVKEEEKEGEKEVKEKEKVEKKEEAKEDSKTEEKVEDDKQGQEAVEAKEKVDEQQKEDKAGETKSEEKANKVEENKPETEVTKENNNDLPATSKSSDTSEQASVPEETTNGDDVIKSAVDIKALSEAIESAKDTTL